MKCIPSLLKQTYGNLEVIVVDNASVDGASALVKEHFPEVKVVIVDENRGFGSGCNAGAQDARGRYLLFCNEDMVFDKNYVKTLVRELEIDPLIGVATRNNACLHRIQNRDRESEDYSVTGTTV